MANEICQDCHFFLVGFFVFRKDNLQTPSNDFLEVLYRDFGDDSFFWSQEIKIQSSFPDFFYLIDFQMKKLTFSFYSFPRGNFRWRFFSPRILLFPITLNSKENQNDELHKPDCPSLPKIFCGCLSSCWRGQFLPSYKWRYCIDRNIFPFGSWSICKAKDCSPKPIFGCFDRWCSEVHRPKS